VEYLTISDLMNKSRTLFSNKQFLWFTTRISYVNDPTNYTGNDL